MFGIGSTELIILLLIVAILFGPSRLPELGRKLGQTVRELRKAKDELMTGINNNDEREPDDSNGTNRNN